jgi:hypothetical protein
LDYNFVNQLSKYQLDSQVGFRKIYPDAFNRYLAISTVEIPHENSVAILKLKSPIIKTFNLGTGLIYTQNFDANDNLEFRLFQGFKFAIPLVKAITISNYIRLEERFQNNFSGSGWTSGIRLRYKVSTVLD